LIRLAVRCRPQLAERVLAELVQLAPGGVEEDQGDGFIEFAIYGAPGELPELPDLEAVAGEGLVEITSAEVPEDWADRWQDFHQPLLVGGRIWVRPSWEEPREGAIDLVIDPGRAFGTGAHPTTRMCLELLAELADAGVAAGPLADWGLALACSRSRPPSSASARSSPATTSRRRSRPPGRTPPPTASSWTFAG
jgi:ribosomal protein L11 methyltransferase